MKISYQREFKHNYLIIDTTELLWQGYECHMMAQNQIDGILRFQIRQMDDGVRFYYEITAFGQNIGKPKHPGRGNLEIDDWNFRSVGKNGSLFIV